MRTFSDNFRVQTIEPDGWSVLYKQAHVTTINDNNKKMRRHFGFKRTKEMWLHYLFTLFQPKMSLLLLVVWFVVTWAVWRRQVSSAAHCSTFWSCLEIASGYETQAKRFQQEHGVVHTLYWQSPMWHAVLVWEYDPYPGDQVESYHRHSKKPTVHVQSQANMLFYK